MICNKCGSRMHCVNSREKDNIRYRAYRCTEGDCFNEEWTTEKICKPGNETAHCIEMIWKIHDEQKGIRDGV